MRSKQANLRELIVLALFAALIFAAKVAMSWLPNMHLGAVLLILTALTFGWKAMYTVIIYVVLEGLVYGFGIWWVSYLYIWPLLVVCVMPLRKTRSWLLLSLLGAFHGYAFGALCAIPFAITGGIGAGISYWVAGIPYDLIHGTANLILCAILLRPLSQILDRLWFRFRSA